MTAAICYCTSSVITSEALESYIQVVKVYVILSGIIWSPIY